MELTLIIPEQNSVGLLADQLPMVCQWLDQCGSSYEILIVDDASGREASRLLQQLLLEYPSARAIQLRRRQGLSACLTAGMRAARGERLIVMEAGCRYSPEYIPLLLRRLVRADMVVARPARKGLAKWLQRLSRIPRWALLGLEVRDPECLFWAAHREAVQGVELPRGMYRYLSSLVTLRGYRVSEICITTNRGPAPNRLTDGFPNPFDLLSVWWMQRRWNDAVAYPMGDAPSKPSILPFQAPTISDDNEQRRSA